METCALNTCVAGTPYTNACGGCTVLSNAPSSACGTCGNSVYKCSGTDNVVCTVQTPSKQCVSTNVLQTCTGGAWVTTTTCSNVCASVSGSPQCTVCTPNATACEVDSLDPGSHYVITCKADGTGWAQTAHCFDMTPDCLLNSLTGAYECASLSPFDLDNDFQLDDSLPAHRFHQEGQGSIPVQQLLEEAAGFALA